jgi:hypothetical protein
MLRIVQPIYILSCEVLQMLPGKQKNKTAQLFKITDKELVINL